jgi:hypothetical protein
VAWEAPQEYRCHQIPIDFGLAAVAAAAGDLGRLVVGDNEDRQGRLVVEESCILEGCSSHRAGPALLEEFDRLLDTVAMAVGSTAAVVNSLVGAGPVKSNPDAGPDNSRDIAEFVRTLVAGPEEFRTDPSASTATTPGHQGKPRTQSLLYFLPDPTSLLEAREKERGVRRFQRTIEGAVLHATSCPKRTGSRGGEGLARLDRARNHGGPRRADHLLGSVAEPEQPLPRPSKRLLHGRCACLDQLIWRRRKWRLFELWTLLELSLRLQLTVRGNALPRPSAVRAGWSGAVRSVLSVRRGTTPLRRNPTVRAWYMLPRRRRINRRLCLLRSVSLPGWLQMLLWGCIPLRVRWRLYERRTALYLVRDWRWLRNGCRPRSALP